MNHSDLLEAALQWHATGVVPFPVRTDNSKAPQLSTWTKYQNQKPALNEILAWFGSNNTDGIGVLTGQISNLEMVELESRAMQEGALEQLKQHAADNEATEILDRIMAGYTETTPSGGIHLLYRIANGTPRKNTKLARRPSTPQELANNPKQKTQLLAESRGEGGFVVVAPSFGRTHETGNSWELTSGGIPHIATIEIEERDRLWSIIQLLDTVPQAPELATQQPSKILGSRAGTRPGDDYCQRETWENILQPHGWTRAYRMGNGYAWRKPGKNSAGISATTGQSIDGIDRLFVFSTSTEFESERPYNKFAAYALLEHANDFTAAARDLATQGYGTQPQQDTTITPTAAHTTTQQHDNTQTLTQTHTNTTTSPDIAASTLMLSEDGFSQALIAEHGASIRYCSERGRWLHWDGSRWQWQAAGGGFIKELAKSVARQLPDGQQAELNHKKRCSSATGIANALTLASTDYRIAVSIDELDARPWELNTPGGIINLKTGQLQPSDPTKLHTRSTTVAPDFTANQTAWTTFLNTTFQGDTEIINWIQRLMGYACVGSVREAILPVFYGQGANGKTVLLETIQMILGDYATVAPQKFLVQGMTQHATEIAAIAGARLVIASETNEGERFDEAKVKILTGGDSIKARFMRQDEFTFTPSHLLVMMTNHRPEVGSGGTSFWRRLREVPFTHVVPPEQRDPELREKLTEQHAPAIMAWLAQGAALYAASGLKEPEIVKTATKTYEQSTDTVARFVDDVCLIGGGEHVKIQAGKVRDAYEHWCAQEGETPVNIKAFGTAIKTRFGIGSSRDMRSRFYTNLSLLGGTDDE